MLGIEVIPIDNPSLTNNVSDITNGNYGLGSSGIINNSNWGIYASKLGLGQAIFESSGWSGANAVSVDTSWPWFLRGGQSALTTSAGVESLSRNTGGASANSGFRGGSGRIHLMEVIRGVLIRIFGDIML
ncbi:hypothetical protein FWH09_00155 [Candidatus Saccharibacteria bacterium]|nr:hypothetical protein [Candidatus Saccharibacteria bacterium]